MNSSKRSPAGGIMGALGALLGLVAFISDSSHLKSGIDVAIAVVSGLVLAMIVILLFRHKS
jgi:hypothetical protein